MIPSVFLAREDDAICVREFQRFKRKQRQRIFDRVAAVKEFATLAALCVCNPKRPWSRELRNEWPFEFDSRLTNKYDLFAVRRPNWTGIATRGWREISDLLRRQIEHCDKRVIFAIRVKGDPLSVRRPAGCIAFACQFIELFSLFLAVDRRDPEVFLA